MDLTAIISVFGVCSHTLCGKDAYCHVTERDRLMLIAPEAALVKIPEVCFVRSPVDAQVVLAGIPDASNLLRRLLDGGHSVVAGRLAGAFRRIGRGDVADEIITVMKRAGHDVRESDPFAPAQTLRTLPRTRAAIVDRLHSLSESMREPVIAALPAAPGLPEDMEPFARFLAERVALALELAGVNS